MVSKQDEYKLLERIIQELNNLKITQDKSQTLQITFTEDEIKALKKLAAREIAWSGIGMIATSYKQIITYLGFFIVTWLAVKGYISEWIISILKGQ